MRRFLICLVLLVTACALPPADPARVQQSDALYAAARAGDADALAAQTTPRIRTEINAAKVAELKAATLPGEPKEACVLLWRVNAGLNGTQSYELVRQLNYDDQAVVVWTVAVKQGEGPWLTDAFNLNIVSRAQADAASGFSLKGKSPGQYLMLAGLVLFPLICLSAVVVAAWRRRWGWMIGSLFGFSQVAVNWTTGQWGFQILYFGVLGAGAVKGAGPFDPWIVTLSLPIPAILFWVLKRYRPKPPKVKKGKVEAVTPPPQADTPEL